MPKKSEKYDAIIVGAGPGGLAAAQVLGEAGKKVLLVEANKVIGPKCCAGGLTLKDFKECRIDEKLLSRRFDSVVLEIFGFKKQVSYHTHFLATLSRYKLGQFMLRKLKKKKVKVVLGKRVDEIGKDFVFVENKKYFFKQLIGADGSNSIVRKHLKIPIKKYLMTFQYYVPGKFKDLSFHASLRYFGLGYAWIFPHKDIASIGCGVDSKSRKLKRLNRNFHAWLRKKRIPIKDLKLAGFPINYDYRGCVFDNGNVFLIGDAAGLASGLSGEGIFPAVMSGKEIAKRILDKKYEMPELRKWLRSKKQQEQYLEVLHNPVRLFFFVLKQLIRLQRKGFRKKLVEMFSV